MASKHDIDLISMVEVEMIASFALFHEIAPPTNIKV